MKKLILALVFTSAFITGSRAIEPVATAQDAVIRTIPPTLNSNGHLVGPQRVITRTSTAGYRELQVPARVSATGEIVAPQTIIAASSCEKSSVSSRAAEIARLSALPAITVSMRDAAVSTVLKEIADKSGTAISAAVLPQVISVNFHDSPWNLLQQMVEADWITLDYADSTWTARSGRLPETMKHTFRHLGGEGGANTEPAAVADVRKIVAAFAPSSDNPGAQVSYCQENHTLTVLATYSVRKAVASYLAQVDRPKTHSTYTVSVAGQKFEAQGLDGSEIVLGSFHSMHMTEEVPAVGKVTRKWAVRNVDVGTGVYLQRVGTFTSCRIKVSQLVWTKTSNGTVEPTIAEEEVESIFLGDQASVTLSAVKTVVEKRFLFLRWTSTKTLPATVVEIQRSDVS